MKGSPAWTRTNPIHEDKVVGRLPLENKWRPDLQSEPNLGKHAWIPFGFIAGCDPRSSTQQNGNSDSNFYVLFDRSLALGKKHVLHQKLHVELNYHHEGSARELDCSLCHEIEGAHQVRPNRCFIHPRHEVRVPRWATLSHLDSQSSMFSPFALKSSGIPDPGQSSTRQP